MGPHGHFMGIFHVRFGSGFSKVQDNRMVSRNLACNLRGGTQVEQDYLPLESSVFP